MQVSPVNISQMQFKSKIVPNKFFMNVIGASRNNIEQAEYKSLNYAKEFYDCLNKIKSDKNVKEVAFFADKETHKAYAHADGVQVLEIGYDKNMCESYAIFKTIKKYAETLKVPPVITDAVEKCKADYEKAMQDLVDTNERYKEQLGQFFENLVKEL